VRCVLKRMLPMSGSSGAKGRPKVGFYDVKIVVVLVVIVTRC
jgi:hypothetical protein